ncbi:MAG TPA: peroxidase-related enzyme [Acidimicrobiales bacterium]|nr:peroxidase-related enzyme [Acidimicrobiales bacterium]
MTNREASRAGGEEWVMPFSRFPIPNLEDLDVDVREQIIAARERLGFIPNVHLALAHRPDEYRAFFTYRNAVMDREGGLSGVEREMIVVATSATVNCTYCVVSHGAMLRMRSGDPVLADKIAIDYRHAPLSPRQRAMLDYAVKLSIRPQEITEADRGALVAVGFDSDDIWDISSVVAFFALSNRMVHALDLAPNDEFFSLGRAAPEGS